MAKFRKKPVVVEAVQWTGNNLDEIRAFMGAPKLSVIAQYLKIRTLEGELDATPGDWIIKGVKGEFYPCKPDVFERTYKAAPDG